MKRSPLRRKSPLKASKPMRPGCTKRPPQVSQGGHACSRGLDGLGRRFPGLVGSSVLGASAARDRAVERLAGHSPRRDGPAAPLPSAGHALAQRSAWRIESANIPAW